MGGLEESPSGNLGAVLVGRLDNTEQINPVDLIGQCVRGLVTQPNKVNVTLTDNIISVEVAAGDESRVIGAGGAMARCLRLLLMAVSRNQGTRYALELPQLAPRYKPLLPKAERPPSLPRKGV